MTKYFKLVKKYLIRKQTCEENVLNNLILHDVFIMIFLSLSIKETNTNKNMGFGNNSVNLNIFVRACCPLKWSQQQLNFDPPPIKPLNYTNAATSNAILKLHFSIKITSFCALNRFNQLYTLYYFRFKTASIFVKWQTKQTVPGNGPTNEILQGPHCVRSYGH